MKMNGNVNGEDNRISETESWTKKMKEVRNKNEKKI